MTTPLTPQQKEQIKTFIAICKEKNLRAELSEDQMEVRVYDAFSDKLVNTLHTSNFAS